MTRTWFVVPAAALVLGISVPNPARAFPAPQYGAYAPQEGWAVPPQQLNDMQRRGFQDGVEGARKDAGNGRSPNVNNRDEYRNPESIPVPQRDAYRDGFRRGYAAATSHLWGAPTQSPYPPPSAYAPAQSPYPQQPSNAQQPQNWDSWGMRGLGSDAEREGYRTGVEEARKDFHWQRRPDPDGHEEYQNPYVAPQFVDDYRRGFMRGYTVAMSQLNGDPAWQYGGDPDQWQAPGRFTEMQRTGFRDGIDGARKDFGNHRAPDPNNRDEYRSPNVPDQLRHEYREGFRRGYEMAAAQLWGVGM